MTFPPPTGAQLLRSLRAPLVGYAWLLGGALLTTVLIVLATNTGSTGKETGVDSSDTSGIGVLIGMPFQIAAMALFGSLHLGSDGTGISLFMPPLLLTGLFVFGTVRATSRGEAVPAAGTRALLSIAVGFLAAVVVTPSTWALAMRESGVTLHAASVSLFFGSWALTGLGVYVGASRAACARRPSWIPSDYAVATGLWLQSLLTWVAVAAPVLTVVAGVREALWLSLVAPLWAVTAGLYSYSLGHFGALTLANQNLNVWDLEPVWTVLLIVGALALAVLTSIAWHLRRDTRPASLATAASWVVLPAVYAVGGIALWLLCTVVLGGGIGGVSGSLTLQPAFWVLFVLGGWGLAVEAVSRFVAPSLVPAMPTWLVAKLRGHEPPAAQNPLTTPGVAADDASTVYEPRPLTPEERARYKRVGIAVSALVVLAVVGWVAVALLNSQLYGPEGEARSYLNAVVHADLKSALDLAPVGDEGSDDLLTSAIYRAADKRITGYQLGEIKKDGSKATVQVRLEGLDSDARVELALEKAGHTAVVFDNWRVSDAGLARLVSLATPDNSDGLTVNGVAARSVSDDVWLLPGTYDIDPYAGNKWLESTGDPVAVSADDSPQFLHLPTAKASDAFVSEVQRQVDAYIAKCMAATELEPADCPNSAYGGSEVRNVHWTLIKAPAPDFESFDGTFPADLSYGEEGRATVTYESDESYGFGAPDWQPQTEESDLYLSSVVVTEEGGGLVVKIGDSMATGSEPSGSDDAGTQPPSDAPFAPDIQANGCVTKAEYDAATVGITRAEIEKTFGAPVGSDVRGDIETYVACDLQHAATVTFSGGRLVTKQWSEAS